MDDASRELEKDLKAINEAHKKPLRHYVNQPNARRMRRERNRRRWKKAAVVLDFVLVVVSTLMIVLLVLILWVLSTIKIKLGL